MSTVISSTHFVLSSQTHLHSRVHLHFFFIFLENPWPLQTPFIVQFETMGRGSRQDVSQLEALQLTMKRTFPPNSAKFSDISMTVFIFNFKVLEQNASSVSGE